jgi:alpha-methylacyl-CoA racemase
MRQLSPATGPLTGLIVLEMSGIGPAPFCGQLLADHGADVIVIEREREPVRAERPVNLLRRGKRSVTLDLKTDAGRASLLELVKSADVLIEGYRPGVMERLQAGPEHCQSRNRRLVYARVTGWGQNGPYSHGAGHDINYIALTGALNAIGPAEGPPTPPLNLLGDFSAGGMFLAFGIVSAVLEARKSGVGQVVDVAITDATAYLMGQIYSFDRMGFWSEKRASNLLDGGCPYYRAYRTSDGRFIAIGAIEDRFFDQLLHALEIDAAAVGNRREAQCWPRLERLLRETIAKRSRDEWEQRLAGTDVCFAPVLSYLEAPQHSQNIARNNFVEVDGALEPAPVPKFSRTPGSVRAGAPFAGEDTDAVLAMPAIAIAEEGAHSRE